MRFKLQTKDGPRAKWRDIRFVPTFATEAEAWIYAERFDPDGYVCRATLRVVPN